MDIESVNITLKCLFCDSDLEKTKSDTFQSGDLVRCTSCKQENDYDSLIYVAKDKGIEQLQKQVTLEAKKAFSKLFK
jgi:hypothetical protein